MRAVALVGACVLALVGCGDDDPAGSPPSTSRQPSTSTSSSTSTTRTDDARSTPTTSTGARPAGVERLRVEVVERLPHDAGSFTQGLELGGDVLYESAGLYGESSVRRVDPDGGDTSRRVELGDEYFAEGLTLVDDELVVLTWREGTAFVLDAVTLQELDRHRYDGEGWGICDDGDRLVMSDGTSTLRFRDREDFGETGSVEVLLDGRPVVNLNELECVDDAVYANVWQTDTIVRIDPSTGRVTAVIDATGLLSAEEQRDADVLNGIAFDPASQTFLVTGKHWPALFRVRFVAAT